MKGKVDEGGRGGGSESENKRKGIGGNKRKGGRKERKEDKEAKGGYWRYGQREGS